MKIMVLMAQRKERYDGEYLPEALACMAGVGYEEYPEYLDEQKKKADASGEFERAEIVGLDVDYAALMRLLRPGAVTLAAAVVPPAE